MTCLKLFWSFFQIGLFSFGGGYAALPLIQNQVSANQWLTPREFADLVTISQMTPGPIALNASTFVGMRLAGAGGAVAATFGCVFPSCVIVSALAVLYRKYKDLGPVKGVLSGLRPTVVAMIASAGLNMALTAFWGEAGFSPALRPDAAAVCVFAAGLALLRKFKPNPIFVMLLAGAAGLAVYGPWRG